MMLELQKLGRKALPLEDDVIGRFDGYEEIVVVTSQLSERIKKRKAALEEIAQRRF